METIQYNKGKFSIPADAVCTEITPYLWPGHYGEWDAAAQMFTAWKLISPSMWHVTSEILAPPMVCTMGPTVLRWRFQQSSQAFHLELCQSSGSGHLSLKDQLGKHPFLLPGQGLLTHPGPVAPGVGEGLLRQGLPIHPGQGLLIHPGQGMPTHPGQGPAVGPVVGPVVVAPVLLKDQEAIWRIHTHTT